MDVKVGVKERFSITLTNVNTGKYESITREGNKRIQKVGRVKNAK